MWPATIAFLVSAGIDIINPVDGELTSQPPGIRSGTGENIADDFDPGSLLRWLERSRLDPTD